MNARPHNFIVMGETLDPVTAASVASVLGMIADQLRLTATRPSHALLVRKRVEHTVAALIELADALTGDADLEPENDDEPSLGWGALSSRLDDGSDREQDAGDEPERDPDFEQTALERHGRGFPADPTRGDDEDGRDDELSQARVFGGAGA